MSRAELAGRKGVSPGAVTKACKPGGPLHAATLEGGAVDFSHPATKDWLERKPRTRRKAEASEDVDEVEDVDETDELDDDSPAEDWDPLQSPEQLAGLTYEEARRRYSITLQQWVDATKRVAETQKVKVAVAQKRGELVARELIENYVFGALDALSERLLRDASRTIAIDCYTLGQRNAPREEAVTTAREHLESQLTPVKEAMIRSLEAAIEKARGG